MTVKPITEDDLHAFVDGLLDESRRTDVVDYLEAHPETADRIDAYRAQRLALKVALDPVTSEVVPTRLNLAHMIEARRRPRSFSWNMAAAAVLLILAGGAGGWMLHSVYQPESEGVLALAREASDSYKTYASDQIRPVELRARDTGQLIDWATERMGRKPVLPDLSRSGYRLMGGRIVSTPHGAALMVMYDNDRGTRLVMLTRPMAVDQDKPMTPLLMDNSNGWSWAVNGMGYSLVGRLPSDALHPLADDIRTQVASNA